MADNQFSVAVPNVLQALMAGEQGYDKVRGVITQRAQDAARQEAQQALVNGDTRGALARLIGANDPKMAAVLSGYDSAQSGQNGVYGTPIYGTDERGNTVLGAIGKTGRFVPIDTGGVRVNPGVKTIDTGTGTLVIDSRTGQPMTGGRVPVPGGQPQPPQGPQVQGGYVPKDIAGEAREKKFGAEQGEKIAKAGSAKAALDSSSSNIDRMSDVARNLANDPALGKITGLTGVFPNMPGGRAANVQARLDNLLSQAGFAVLQAMRDASKTGGALGQVSDFENRQLQNNLAALQRAQSEDQFRSELKKIVQWGEGVKQRLHEAYNTDYGSLGQPQGGQQSKPSAPPAAIEFLRANPASRSAFDAKYGAGSSASVLGQ